MSPWRHYVVARWLRPLPDRDALRALAEAPPGSPPTRALDRAAFIGLALHTHGGDAALNEAATGLSAALARPAVESVWRTHRGAVLALLEGWASSLPAWRGAAAEVARDAMLGLLVTEASWGRRAGTGVSFRVVETLGFRTAEALAATGDDAAVIDRAAQCALAFAVDEPAGRRWAAEPSDRWRWLDGARSPTPRGSPCPMDRVPFGALCDPRRRAWRDRLGRAFAAAAAEDVTLYDRAPLHVAAISAMVEAAGGGRGEAALGALDSVPLERLPGRLFARLKTMEAR